MSRTHLQNGSPVEHRRAHEDHAVSRNSRRRRVVDVVHLEENLGVGRHRDSVAVGQCERLVVVKYRVQVLGPAGVDRAVEEEPHVVGCGRTNTRHGTVHRWRRTSTITPEIYSRIVHSFWQNY